MKFKIEEERKFLVKKMLASALENGGREITQWYICMNPPVRVRVENFDECSLTIKIKKPPHKTYKKRPEIEGRIPKRAIPDLEAARKHNKIRKTRYSVDALEVDVFLAQLEGLVLLEFEKKSDENTFRMPLGFLVEEVTGDERFENHNLAKLKSIPEEWRCEIV